MKICFNNQIHRLSRFPISLNSLLKTLSSLFPTSLPLKFDLYYIDHENDKIILSEESDFQFMIENTMNEPHKVIKIFIIPSQEEPSNKENLVRKRSVERLRCPSPAPIEPNEEEFKQEEDPRPVHPGHKIRLTDAQRQRLKDLIKHYYKINTIRDRIAERKYESCRKEEYLKKLDEIEAVVSGNCLSNFMQRSNHHSGFGNKIVKPCCH